MLRTALAAAAALTFTTGAALAETRTYDLAPFDRVDIATGLHAEIVQGETQSVRIETTRNGILDQIDIDVRNGQLRARRDSDLLDIILGGGFLNMLDFGRDVTIYITVPELVGITAASGAIVSADNAAGDRVELSSSSGARIDLAAAKASELRLDASSGGNLSVAGSCERLDLDVSSGAHISAKSLSCVDANVSGSSGASAEFGVSGEINGAISSGARLHLASKPDAVNVKSSSGANLSIN